MADISMGAGSRRRGFRRAAWIAPVLVGLTLVAGATTASATRYQASSESSYLAFLCCNPIFAFFESFLCCCNGGATSGSN
jgi:hypothetical protein